MKFSAPSFLVLGRAGMDFYADPPGTPLEVAITFKSALGGSAGNAAAGLARLGHAVSMASMVADDAVGRFVLNQLKAYGVDVSYVGKVHPSNRTSLAVVDTRWENNQNVLYRSQAADLQLSPEQIEQIDFSKFGAMLMTGTGFSAEPTRAAHLLAIKKANRAGTLTVIDLDYRPTAWTSRDEARDVLLDVATRADVVIGNDEEFAVLAGDSGLAFAESLNSPTKIVVYKMGEHGAITFANGTKTKSNIFSVTPLKPTGAGDSFMAAFMSSLAKGRDVKEAVKRGSAAAAIVVMRVGCAPAMPTEQELNQFIVDNDHAFRAV
ncbi:MAG: 5-dehydro-2-deoxygluconokinase [Aestuariivirga sp.]